MIITKGPVSPAMISEMIAKACEELSAGGHSLFIGQVRNDLIGGKRVKAIDYSAYEEMVMSEAEKIRSLILSEYNDVKDVEIVHSTGVVGAGEISLCVVVSAGHRHQATEACSRTVELIKQKLPVWKKEIFEDDSSHWRLNSKH